MSLPIFDPTDETVVALWNEMLGNVHNPRKCEGQYCVIHKPSDHKMRSFPLHWRADSRIMERICPHGIGHPDPDDLAYNRRIKRFGLEIHGCCGVCWCCEYP
jgi:hypothetical protein